MTADEGFTTSLTLLGRLRRTPKDEIAWDDFVNRYGKLITHWCRRWGMQQTDAEDVTQNVLLELSRQMKDFQYDPAGRFRSWLKTVSYRAWCDFLRQRGRRKDTGTGDSDVRELLSSREACDDLTQQLEDEWRREMLEKAMRLVQNRVQPHTWEAFCLLTQQGLSGAETAERLDMKVGAVWVAKSKVQKMIQGEIRNLEDLEQV